VSDPLENESSDTEYKVNLALEYQSHHKKFLWLQLLVPANWSVHQLQFHLLKNSDVQQKFAEHQPKSTTNGDTDGKKTLKKISEDSLRLLHICSGQMLDPDRWLDDYGFCCDPHILLINESTSKALVKLEIHGWYLTSEDRTDIFCLWVSSTWTVQQLMNCIARRPGYELFNWHLLYNVHTMKSVKYLSDYGISFQSNEIVAKIEVVTWGIVITMGAKQDDSLTFIHQKCCGTEEVIRFSLHQGKLQLSCDNKLIQSNVKYILYDVSSEDGKLETAEKKLNLSSTKFEGNKISNHQLLANKLYQLARTAKVEWSGETYKKTKAIATSILDCYDMHNSSNNKSDPKAFNLFVDFPPNKNMGIRCFPVTITKKVIDLKTQFAHILNTAPTAIELRCGKSILDDSVHRRVIGGYGVQRVVWLMKKMFPSVIADIILTMVQLPMISIAYKHKNENMQIFVKTLTC